MSAALNNQELIVLPYQKEGKQYYLRRKNSASIR